MKKCPYCAEEIQDEAIVCKHCGRELRAITPPTDPDAVIYQSEKVTITRARAVLGDKTFAINNISSVSVATIPPSSGGGLLFTVAGGLGLVIALTGLTGEFGSTQIFCGSIGAVLLFVGIMILRGAKDRYAVRIASTSGESNALESYNKAELQPIVEAMNKAMVERSK